MLLQTPPPAVASPIVAQGVRRPQPSHGVAHTRMDCRVTVEGCLAGCRLLSEEPKGAGFGESALKIADTFHVTPPMRDGRPIEGRITIPIEWRLDDDPPGDAGTAPAAKTAPDPSSAASVGRG